MALTNEPIDAGQDEQAVFAAYEGDGVPRYEGDIGELAPLARPEVDLTLHPSRSVLVAGDLWSITGVIHNRSQHPVWIVDTKTRLALAPEMYGATSQRGSLGAFFPTTIPRRCDEIVRLDPGAKYNVIWKIDTVKPVNADSGARRGILPSIFPRWRRDPRPKKHSSLGHIGRIISAAIRDYVFFSPGSYRISSTVHVWSSPPLYEGTELTNMGASFPISADKTIEVEASPWVLILGAAVGGIMCFSLQMFLGLVRFGSSPGSNVVAVLGGLLSAIILCGVGTVLISRLAKTDFVVVVKVRDVWGAVATGFIIQWFGYEALLRLLPAIR